MIGLLNIDKPPGLTSRDVVNRVQRLVRPVKVGHAGTLDPLATGVLLICLGAATRLVPYIHRYSKTYVAELLFGFRSESHDVESELVPVIGAATPTAERIRATLPQFLGRTLQTPPAHSAVKVQGRPAYKLARRGEQVELAPREIEITRLELLDLQDGRATLELECSSGTYVRSLCRDVGEALGTGGVMSQLRRTRIGPFSVEQGLGYRELTAPVIAARIEPPVRAVEMLPVETISDAEVVQLQHGRRLTRNPGLAARTEVALRDSQGVLIAIAEALDSGDLAPRLVFPAG